MTIIDQLKRDEGLRLNPYQDTLGFWTVGYGHKMGPQEHYPAGISQDEAELLLQTDLQRCTLALNAALPWVAGLDDPRQGALQNMAYNIGVHGLLGFKQTLAAVESGEYAVAAEKMLESRWASQVGPRALRLAAQMRDGEWT